MRRWQLLAGVALAGLLASLIQVAASESSPSGARAWGLNNYGQLGDGSTISRTTPVTVSGLTGATSIAAGGHTCALISGGEARCWGENTWGQLGDGTTTHRSTPVAVLGLSGATAIAVSSQHTCALISDGTARCWGINYEGRLGDGTDTSRTTPVPVTGISGATAISAGLEHTCALISDGTARCWGTNFEGQLGDGPPNKGSSTPVTVSELSDARGISAGGYHTCALISDGRVRCWGRNWEGQLGDGSTISRTTPVTVSGLTGATAIGAGGSHTCALVAGGEARCWGSNELGRLGDGTTINRSTPVAVSGLSGATAIGAGGSHTCALVAGGEARCWGGNHSGQLGDGTTTHRSTPVEVSGLSSATVISAGSQHTVASFEASCTNDSPPGKILDVRMTGSKTLRVRYQVDQGIQVPSTLSLEVRINSATMTRQLDAPTPSPPVGGLSQPRVSEEVFDLEAERVTRFSENIVSVVRLQGTREGGACFLHELSGQKILLPVIAVHGITSDLAVWFGLTDIDLMYELGNQAQNRWGYQRGGAYPTWIDHVTSTREGQRDQIPDLREAINGALGATYASRVNIVGHSMGGLIARGFMQESANQVRWLIAIASPNEGSAKVYRPADCPFETCVAAVAILPAVRDLYPTWTAVWQWNPLVGDSPWPLEHHSEYLTQINSVPIPGGRFSAVCGEEISTLYTVYRQPTVPALYTTRSERQGDGTVPLWSCFIAGHELVRVSEGEYDHGTIVLAPKTTDLIEARFVD